MIQDNKEGWVGKGFLKPELRVQRMRFDEFRASIAPFEGDAIKVTFVYFKSTFLKKELSHKLYQFDGTLNFADNSSNRLFVRVQKILPNFGKFDLSRRTF